MENNITGVRRSYTNELNNLIGYEMEDHVLLDQYVLEIMKRLTLATKREILICTDEKSRVQWVNTGDATTVNIGNAEMEYHVKALNKYRVIHTHPGGNPQLSAEDFSAAKKQNLQCIIAVGVDEKTITGFGIGVPMVEEESMEYRSSLIKTLKELNQFPLERYVHLADQYIKRHVGVELGSEEEEEERALLIGLDLPGNKGMTLSDSMEELRQLVKTAGGNVVGNVCQARGQIDPTYYLGKGKIQELIRMIQNVSINLIVTNDELNARQIANIEAATGTKTVDRTTIILDIFARHAKTKEGQLQVELAQQKYRMSHLKGLGIVMSRTGGGIGTRGPGEKKLEIDRRHIRKQLDELEARIMRINRSNQVNVRQRKKNNVKTVGLVGYTNSGKSTLFNQLTQSEVVTEDGLFITLDSTLRKVNPEQGEYLVSDTVGFIEKLPHDLIRAFKTTLMEAQNADILLHVVDVSNHHYEAQIQVVEQVLADIGAGNKKMLTIYNKIDTLPAEERTAFLLKNQAVKETGSIYISAKKGLAIQELHETIHWMLTGEKQEIKLLIPYDDNKSIAQLHEMKVVKGIEYQPEGNLLTIEAGDDFPKHLFEEYWVKG